MKPSLYIGIDGRQITKCSPTVQKRKDLMNNYPYVLEGYETKDKKFVYKIFKKDEEQTSIVVGNWRIENIRPSHDLSIAFLFDLVDPKGMISEDKLIPSHQVIEGNETFLCAKFIFNDNTGLNDMMNIAVKAAQYKDWTDFIKNETI